MTSTSLNSKNYEIIVPDPDSWQILAVLTIYDVIMLMLVWQIAIGSDADGGDEFLKAGVQPPSTKRSFVCGDDDNDCLLISGRLLFRRVRCRKKQFRFNQEVDTA